MDKIRHVPSLQALQTLVEVARCASFTQAAQQLCLTQSAVSRQIQQLESHFNVALFIRTSRSLRLTPEGEQVLASAISILDQLKSLEERLVPQQRPFRIRMHVSLAVRWLLPRLSDFYLSHPEVSLAIETVATEVVEPASDSDAYILYLPQPSTEADCLTLFEEPWCRCVRPTLRGHRGQLMSYSVSPCCIARPIGRPGSNGWRPTMVSRWSATGTFRSTSMSWRWMQRREAWAWR
jgi:LysR family glycine cleavage system transcriptional activator